VHLGLRCEVRLQVVPLALVPVCCTLLDNAQARPPPAVACDSNKAQQGGRQALTCRASVVSALTRGAPHAAGLASGLSCGVRQQRRSVPQAMESPAGIHARSQAGARLGGAGRWQARSGGPHYYERQWHGRRMAA